MCCGIKIKIIVFSQLSLTVPVLQYPPSMQYGKAHVAWLAILPQSTYIGNPLEL